MLVVMKMRMVKTLIMIVNKGSDRGSCDDQEEEKDLGLKNESETAPGR